MIGRKNNKPISKKNTTPKKENAKDRRNKAKRNMSKASTQKVAREDRTIVERLPKKKTIVILAVVMFILYIILYAFPALKASLQPTYVIQYGEFLDRDKSIGYFSRYEIPYVAEVGGNTEYLLKENTLARTGSTVLQVSGEGGKPSSKLENMAKAYKKNAKYTKDFKLENEGLVSFFMDGNETRLSPDKLKNISYEKMTKLNQSDMEDMSRSQINKGEPVFKIVDRTKWYILTFLDKKRADEYEVGRKVTLEINGDELDARVMYSKEEKGQLRVILETNTYYSKLAQLRVNEIGIVLNHMRGILVENRCITQKNAMDGVMRKTNTGRYEFVPINIIAKGDEYSVVSKKLFYDHEGKQYDTVDTYDELLRNP